MACYNMPFIVVLLSYKRNTNATAEDLRYVAKRILSSPAKKSLRGGNRGPEAGVRGIP